MIITGIKSNKKNQISIYADGEYLLSVPAEVFAKMHLKVGCHIDEETIEKALSEANCHFAKDKALRILSYRAHSKKELENKIKRKFGENSANSAVEKMESLGLINDKEFAENYATQLARIKGYSVKRIKYELAEKGISRETICEVMENLNIDETEILARVIDKKHMADITDEKELKRAVSYLMRLGYSWNRINLALKCKEDI